MQVLVVIEFEWPLASNEEGFLRINVEPFATEFQCQAHCLCPIVIMTAEMLSWPPRVIAVSRSA